MVKHLGTKYPLMKKVKLSNGKHLSTKYPLMKKVKLSNGEMLFHSKNRTKTGMMKILNRLFLNSLSILVSGNSLFDLKELILEYRELISKIHKGKWTEMEFIKDMKVFFNPLKYKLIKNKSESSVKRMDEIQHTESGLKRMDKINHISLDRNCENKEKVDHILLHRNCENKEEMDLIAKGINGLFSEYLTESESVENKESLIFQNPLRNLDSETTLRMGYRIKQDIGKLNLKNFENLMTNTISIESFDDPNYHLENINNKKILYSKEVSLNVYCVEMKLYIGRFLILVTVNNKGEICLSIKNSQETILEETQIEFIKIYYLRKNEQLFIMGYDLSELYIVDNIMYEIANNILNYFTL